MRQIDSVTKHRSKSARIESSHPASSQDGSFVVPAAHVQANTAPALKRELHRQHQPRWMTLILVSAVALTIITVATLLVRMNQPKPVNQSSQEKAARQQAAILSNEARNRQFDQAEEYIKSGDKDQIARAESFYSSDTRDPDELYILIQAALARNDTTAAEARLTVLDQVLAQSGQQPSRFGATPEFVTATRATLTPASASSGTTTRYGGALSE